ncbi:hypothetical protein [Streptomyces sp. NPDC006012]|uniref:hypothetical protein n=1 Tax=Streptomyces sp. NPDC006012 TaxID=3364739 RepID=UPI00369B743E
MKAVDFYFYFALLAVVAALPYPTRLISEYGETTTATAVHAGAITLAISLNCAMYLRLLVAPALAAPHVTTTELKGLFRHGVALVLVFATSIPVFRLSEPRQVLVAAGIRGPVAVPPAGRRGRTVVPVLVAQAGVRTAACRGGAVPGGTGLISAVHRQQTADRSQRCAPGPGRADTVAG